MKNNLLSDKLAYNGDTKTLTHLHLCSYNVDRVEEFSGDDLDDVKSHFLPDGIAWLQIHGLEDTDAVQAVCTHFGIDFLVMQDILNTDHASKVEEHDQYNVIISKQIMGDEAMQVCLVQGVNFVLTFQERDNDFFDDVTRAIRNNVLKIRTRQSDYLLSVLLNSLMTSYMSIAAAISDELEELESALLAETNDRDIGVQMQELRRDYMLLKRTVWPLKEQYSRLLRSDSSLLHRVNRPFFNDVNDHLLDVAQNIDICRETLSSLMDLYISNNDLRMNDIMKRLTIVSTIFIPLTFLVGVWGMNFRNMPELEWAHGYTLAWGIMIVIGFVTFLFFRTKKWR